MKKNFSKATMLFSPLLAIISTLLLIIPQSCKKNIYEPKTNSEQGDLSLTGKDAKSVKDFMQVNLVGNNDEYHPARVDPLLVNAWGMAFSPGGTIWISAEAAGVSTVYNKDGGQVLVAVTI